MSRKYRIILLTLSCIVLIGVGYVLERNFENLLKSFWFTSGFLLLILLSLVDQPFFSKDSNIFVNAITAGLSLLVIPIENRDAVFFFFLVLIVYLCVSSYSLMIIRKNSLKDENKAVQFFSRINRILGKPDVLFSAFFIWGALTQYASSSTKLNSLLLFWALFMLLNLPELAKVIEMLFSRKESTHFTGIGTIMGIQSTNIFLVKLDCTYKKNELFSFVEFKCSSDGEYKRGLIFESMLLDQEQWIKVISNQDFSSLCCNIPQIEKPIEDIVYLLDSISDDCIVNKFIGLITDGSKIGKIKFLYASKVCVAEGSMLEVNVNENKVLYQIVDGITHTESLANKNETGYIIGEAIQLGTWNKEKFQFEKYGWVPNMNSPVYLASDIDETTTTSNEIILGNLPGTNYPVILDKKVAITHHTAIIGVTGTGKSIFSRNIIREYIKDENVKVICVDFTGEYKEKFADLKPKSIIDDETSRKLFNDIDFIENEMANNYNKDTANSRKKKIEVYDKVISSVKEFIVSDDEKLSIFELPEVQNTSGVMKYTQTFFKALFKIAKEQENYGKCICLVLEEAHTIIPESNFAGISDKVSQPLINSIAQIALQGRKYNIGLLVIAQRTANVSKTILTQCNSIISFQEYDKTSIDFLSNYFGQEISSALNKLQFRQAVAAGKAFKSSVPMIFEVPEIKEMDSEH
ncbi:ATP-binding protein [Kineothrix sedimenti]|uniref:ATP-binding protein n=1 Tax=Kineothrix sedimenti TaxID=3123317 RepID=A0ABZ3ETK6_9FIRM